VFLGMGYPQASTTNIWQLLGIDMIERIGDYKFGAWNQE
jgi:hypothetical protein